MKSIWPVALITFKEGLRHRVISGVLLASMLLVIFAVLICGLFMRDLLKILLDLCLSAVSISGLLVPLLFAVNQLAGDIENKTIYTILSRPVSRASYMVGRFAGLGLLSGTIIVILTCATLLSVYGATYIYPGNIFTHFSLQAILLSSLAAFLGIQVLTSTVLFWCSITTSSFIATLLTISTYIIGHTLEDLIRFMQAQAAHIKVSPVIQYIVNSTQYIFPNLSAFDLKQQAAHGITIPGQEICFLISYCVLYCLIMLLTSIFFFKKRDL